MNNRYSKIEKLVGLGILMALVIVLQTFASGVKVGEFTLPLSLIPIIVGAILFGPLSGMILGLTFGLVVVFAVVSGAEPFSTLLFEENPFMTVFICLFKGAAAGFMSGLAYRLLEKKNKYLGVLSASILAPLTNTGIFTIGMLTIFYNILSNTAASVGASNTTVFALTAFLGIRFLFEIAAVVILAPIFLRIVTVIKLKR